MTKRKRSSLDPEETSPTRSLDTREMLPSTSSVESRELLEDLLPGVSNNVTLTHILTKLAWTDFRVLCAVNRTWQRAIQSREVYRERIRSHSTETLVAVKHVDESFPECPKQTLSLYCMRARTFYQLPPIPHLRGMSRYSQFFSSYGKLYVTSADCQCTCHICSENWRLEDNPLPCSAERDSGIYVLDLAGHGQWEECTMPTQVIGECEGTGTGCSHREEGDKQYAWGGCKHHFCSSWVVSQSAAGMGMPESRQVEPSVALYLDTVLEKQFTIEGKAYRMRRAGGGRNSGRNHIINFYDDNIQSWIYQHSISSDGVIGIEREVELALDMDTPLGPNHALTVDPVSILPVNNELLAIAIWETRDFYPDFYGFVLLQSIGFGSESNEIMWEKAPNSFWFDARATLAMCPIQL